MKLNDLLNVFDSSNSLYVSVELGETKLVFVDNISNKKILDAINKEDNKEAIMNAEVISIDTLKYGLEIILGCVKHEIDEENIDVVETEKHDSHMYSFIGETECLNCGLTLRLDGEGCQPSDEETPDWDLDDICLVD